MDTTARKPKLPNNNILLKTFSLVILLLLARFAYVTTIRGKSCFSGDFCFTGGEAATDSRVYPHLPYYYDAVFQDLISENYLSLSSKVLSIGALDGQDVVALKEIGVTDSTGIFSGNQIQLPFNDNTFDFVFSGHVGLDTSDEPAGFASEVSRTVKPGGFIVLHTTAFDLYSLNSLLDLFNSCVLVKSREIDGLDSIIPRIHEIVLKKHHKIVRHGNQSNHCSIPAYKRRLIEKSEPLIKDEPLKPWITLKKNVKNIKYLPSMADIRFKNRYVYIDVGARNYSSSIGSWFKKQYPKQNKNFEIYAIEGNKAFQQDYQSRKNVTLLPYVAWVRNETLFFEINREPRGKNEDKWKGLGRIQSVQSSNNFVSDLNKIVGFDFADWVKRSVTERDYVVVKMDVEGTEFHLIPRLVESGAICLIDEMFLECHYNRWQKCCKGQRSTKFRTTYDRCLDLLSDLRERGVLVHQWW